MDMPALACEVIEVCLEKTSFGSSCCPACHIRVELLDVTGTACIVNEVVSAVVVKEHGSVVVHTVELNA